MPYGFGAALTWALDTVILGIALANPAFAATPQAIALSRQSLATSRTPA